jgi:ABC-type multidrug transport system ATPase subunit
MNPIINVQNLSKNFREVNAVDQLSFSVPKGEVYGFLGQNGAGKSTTIRMLLTLIEPSKGFIEMFGHDLKNNRNKVLAQVGAIIEKPDLYTYLTALDNLRIMARLSHYKATTNEFLRQLDMVGLTARKDSKVKTFSQGMKQRLGIACALIHNPQLVILDEPTNGLDPQGIADVRNLILHLSRNEGKTILVSSHLLSEIELVADSMLIIDKGQKLAEGKVNELIDPAQTLVLVQTSDTNGAIEKIAKSKWANYMQKNTNEIVLQMHRNEIPELAKDLVALDIPLFSLQPKISLEAFFLSLTTNNQHVAAYKN